MRKFDRRFVPLPPVTGTRLARERIAQARRKHLDQHPNEEAWHFGAAIILVAFFIGLLW